MRGSAGFTLIELIVVLVIIGLGMFVLLPRLDFTSTGDLSDRGKLDALAVQARQAAMLGDQTQRLVFLLGSNTVSWQDQEAELSGSVAKLLVSGKEPTDLERGVGIYADGHIDQCSILLSSGQTILCDPLSGGFSSE
jgi:prepilin-type N-terminal cleavage/methylation domain-containing protein